MSATDHSKMSLANLNTNFNRLMAKKDDLELEDAVGNKEMIGKIQKKIAEYQSAIDQKTKESEVKTENSGATSLVAPQSQNPLASAEAKFNYNSMLAHFKSNIPTLAPPLDVSVFIQRLDNCYNLFVKSFAYLEPYFIQQAKSQLSSDILENLNASSDETDTFENLKNYLKKNYGSKETPFQIMSELLESAPKDGERIQEWAARQERRSDIVATQIISKFNEHAKQSNKSEMTVKDSFNLFCSMVTYDYLRKNNPDCFKLMVKEVDTCWRPSEVGSLAATLLDRFDKIDPHPAAHPSYSARQQNNRKQQNGKNMDKSRKSNDGKKKSICTTYLTYRKCSFGSKCRFIHLEPGTKEFDDHFNISKGKNTALQQESNETPEANVAYNTCTEDEPEQSGELQPEYVGLDFFPCYGGPKN